MIEYVVYETILGYIKLTYENEAIISLKKINEKPKDFGTQTPLTQKTIKELNEYFSGVRKEFTFPYKLIGTDFQIKVWRALCDIPYGQTRTYKEIAIAIGNEKACRAVGMANNKNPISIAVPCHRVIGANGKLVGYAGGLDMKEKLLLLESGTKIL